MPNHPFWDQIPPKVSLVLLAPFLPVGWCSPPAELFHALFVLQYQVTNCVAGLGTGAPIIESPYGDPVNPEDAPESISRAVASLPPEQMFELMKQMKVSAGAPCVSAAPPATACTLPAISQLVRALISACFPSCVSRTAPRKPGTCCCRTPSWLMHCCRPRWS